MRTCIMLKAGDPYYIIIIFFENMIIIIGNKQFTLDKIYAKNLEYVGEVNK